VETYKKIISFAGACELRNFTGFDIQNLKRKLPQPLPFTAKEAQVAELMPNFFSLKIS